MKLFNLSAISLAMLLTLTACGGDKADTKTQSTPATQATESKNETGTASKADKLTIKSPYMDFQVTANRAMVVADIGTQFQLTPEQSACLQSSEGNANYLESLEPFFKGVLNADEIKEADEFFGSDAGRKFSDMMLGQMGVENLPPFVEPTDDEKMQITKAMLKPFFVKVKTKTDAMSEEEAVNFMMPMMQKEMARCQIS